MIKTIKNCPYNNYLVFYKLRFYNVKNDSGFFCKIQIGNKAIKMSFTEIIY